MQASSMYVKLQKESFENIAIATKPSVCFYCHLSDETYQHMKVGITF
jgi:hypothetical protein